MTDQPITTKPWWADHLRANCPTVWTAETGWIDQPAAPTTPPPCHAAVTGEGYWTCDIPGGCADCRRLAREIDDTYQAMVWADELADALPLLTLIQASNTPPTKEHQPA